jgi:hypothetical protein
MTGNLVIGVYACVMVFKAIQRHIHVLLLVVNERKHPFIKLMDHSSTNVWTTNFATVTISIIWLRIVGSVSWIKTTPIMQLCLQKNAKLYKIVRIRKFLDFREVGSTSTLESNNGIVYHVYGLPDKDAVAPPTDPEHDSEDGVLS